MVKIKLWSDIPRWMTPDLKIISSLLVRIKSIKVADVLVTLVGLLISCLYWQSEDKKLSLRVWASGGCFSISQFKSPISITSRCSTSHFLRKVSKSLNRQSSNFGSLCHVLTRSDLL